MWRATLFFTACAASPPPDAVLSLPTYGKLQQKQYAGFAPVTPDGKNQLHYWFVECDCGNAPGTPLLMWLNGGPGASSLTGLLAEKLGPQSITANGTLVDNPNRITKRYHLLTLDNPVGSGYSMKRSGAYVSSEAEVRTQAVAALRIFFARHPEYAGCPFWVTGESYAGHYVPNIAWEVAVNASEIPLRCVQLVSSRRPLGPLPPIPAAAVRSPRGAWIERPLSAQFDFESGDVLCFNGDVEARCCHGLLEITDKTVAGAQAALPDWMDGRRVSLQWRGRRLEESDHGEFGDRVREEGAAWRGEKPSEA